MGWDSLYTVSLTASTQPTLRGSAPWQPPGMVPPDFKPGNLGGWSNAVRVGHSDSIRLALAAQAETYVLVTEAELDPKNACQYFVRTKVLHLGSRGRPAQERTIFEGIATRECGE